MKTMEAFLKKVPSAKFYTSKFYKKYLSALEMFWSQKRRDALAFLTKTIEEEIDHEDIQVFYRLWIEILSETHDRLALQMLKNHLAKMAPQFADYDQWAALRGLVHFELEEIEACTVILRAVGENTYSPYAMELRQRHSIRISEDTKADLAILNSDAPVTDFFVLQTLAQGLLANAETEKLPTLLLKITDNFPHSPTKDQFLFWQNFEENNLHEAIMVGQKLCKRFPHNDRFRFDLAYASFCNDNVHDAIQTLESLDMKSRKHDPDTMALLGYGYLLESRDQKQSKAWQKAKTYFALAKTQADKLGLPSSEITLNINFMKDEERKKDHTKTEIHSKFWTLPLSPRRESDLMQSTEQEVDFLFHELKKDVHENDIVFLTGSENTRVLAVYKVLQTSVWHPSVKNQGLLELAHRFHRSVYMPTLRSGTQVEMTQLTSEETDTWLNQLEEHIPIRQKINVLPKKEFSRKLRRVS